MTRPDQPQPDDAVLLRTSREDPAAFEAFYDRYVDEVHRFVLRRLGRDLADDLTAETFTTAFRQGHKFDATRGTARAWLFGIAANLIGKHRRTELRGLRAVMRLRADPVADSWVEAADERLAASSAGPALASALAELSVADRHVLLLVAWAELNYAEVAVALDIPVGSVRSRLSRARQRIRRSLVNDPRFAPPIHRTK